MVQTIVLHLRIQCCGFEMKQFRGPTLIAATLVQRASDQLNLVPFDLVVEVDGGVFQVDLLVVILSGDELSLECFNLIGQSFCQHDELIDATLHHTSPPCSAGI